MEIYYRFKNRFLNFQFSLVAEYRFENCRFDLLLYDIKTGEAECIIEVRRISSKKPANMFSKKHLKYSKHCNLVLYISKYSEIDDLLDNIENLFIQKHKPDHVLRTTL